MGTLPNTAVFSEHERLSLERRYARRQTLLRYLTGYVLASAAMLLCTILGCWHALARQHVVVLAAEDDVRDALQYEARERLRFQAVPTPARYHYLSLAEGVVWSRKIAYNDVARSYNRSAALVPSRWFCRAWGLPARVPYALEMRWLDE